MSFSFNFSAGFDEESGANTSAASASISDVYSAMSIGEKRAFEIPRPSIDGAATFVHHEIGGVQFQRIVPRAEGPSDLIPGKYEGGLKLWECSVDLVAYYLRCPELHVGSVLELGCGLGLPGVAALLKGCRPVVFTDFNDDVLSAATWPTIIRSCPNDEASAARCIAGDWLSFSSQLESGRLSGFPFEYDVILSAETLYSLESSAKVIFMLAKHLRAGGIALIATKRYYFGVGGGSMEFLEQLLQRQNFEAEVVAVFEDGSSNTREILKIKKK